MKQTADLGTKPIGKLLWEYSLPGVVAMLVGAVYNILDRVFIGQFSGEGALAGLTVAFPFMMLTFALANLVGIGGGALIAIRFGEKDMKGASHVFGNVITSTVLIGLLMTIVGLANLSGWLRIFGADETTLPYARDFMQIILLGTTFQFLSFALANTVRTEGLPKLSMMSQIVSVLVNLVLALIFVAWLRLGVRGAATATVIGQLSGFSVVLVHYLKGRSILKPARTDWRLDWKLMGKICSIGASGFLGTLGVSVSMTFFNNSLRKYGGVPAITSMGAVNSLFTLFILPIMGIQQGLQPIVGYNHGAGNPKRAHRALFLAIGAAMAMATVVFLLLELFPDLLHQPVHQAGFGNDADSRPGTPHLRGHAARGEHQPDGDSLFPVDGQGGHRHLPRYGTSVPVSDSTGSHPAEPFRTDRLLDSGSSRRTPCPS